MSGPRRYEPDVLVWLAGIRVCKAAGFTVAEIAGLAADGVIPDREDGTP